MDCVNQILPVYDSPLKVERYKGYEQVTRFCPRNSLIPFIIKQTHSATYYPITSLKLVDVCANETEILPNFITTLKYTANASEWTNGYMGNTYDITFATLYWISAACSSSAFAYTTAHSVVKGKIYAIKYRLVVNSGQAPTVYIGDPASPQSNSVVLTAGENQITYLCASATGNYKLILTNTAASNFDWMLVPGSGFPQVYETNCPEIYKFTSVDYKQYNGSYSNTILPLGDYQLKITDANSNIWWTEWFRITDMFKNTISSWTNVDFETFTSSGTKITNCVNSSGAGTAHSNAFYVKEGEVIKVLFNLTLASGSLPTLQGFDSIGGTDLVTGDAACVEGWNEFTFTVSKACYLWIRFYLSTGSTQFSTDNIYVLRQNSDSFTKISFYNSLDLGDILYQKGFIQQLYAWGETKEVASDMTIESDTRQGIMINERIISAPKYMIIHPSSPVLAKVLDMLKQHTSITIIDTLGNSYTANNISVENTPEYYDVNKVVITFTSDEKIWSLNQSNIT